MKKGSQIGFLFFVKMSLKEVVSLPIDKGQLPINAPN